MTLLAIEQSIVARRGGGPQATKAKEYWRSLYQGIKPFLGDGEVSRTRNSDYELELKRVARELGLGSAGNLEDMIVRYCLERLRNWVASHGTPPTLGDLADGFAASLDLSITEVHTEEAIDAVLEEVVQVQKAAIGDLKTEFRGNTDAITVRRLDPKALAPGVLGDN